MRESESQRPAIVPGALLGDAAAPYLKPWWRVIFEAARVSFSYGDAVVACDGSTAAVVRHLIPLLDGGHSVGSIVAAVGDRAAPLVRSALAWLDEQQLLGHDAPLGDRVPSATRDAVHILAATQPGPAALVEDAGRLLGFRAGLIGDAPAAAETGRALAALGAGVHRLTWSPSASAPAADCDVVVVAPRAAELTQLVDWNARALAERIRWFAVLPFDGRFAAAGPLYIPGETACFECFLERRSRNVRDAAQWWAMQEAPASYPSPLPLELTLGGLAAWALVRWRLRPASTPSGSFLALETGEAVRLTAHTVLRVPHCRACARIATPRAPRRRHRAWSA